MVKEVKETELILQNGDVIPYGLCVWCASRKISESMRDCFGVASLNFLHYFWIVVLSQAQYPDRRSTGVGPTDFTTSLPFAKTARGRIAVDDCLHVLVHPHKDHGPKSPAEVISLCTIPLSLFHVQVLHL